MKKERKMYRSSVSGKFVSAAYAKRYPHLTVSHSVKKKVKLVGEAYPGPFIKVCRNKSRTKKQSLMQRG